jgi:CheY-like chemotaxis protein
MRDADLALAHTAREFSEDLTAELESALDHLLTWARRLVRADAGSIYRRHGVHLRLVVAHSDILERRWGTPELRRRLQGLTLHVDSHSIAGHVALTGRVVDVPDVRRPRLDPAWNFCPALDNRTYPYGSILTVPIRSSGQAVGVLQLINPVDADGRPVPFAHEAEVIAARFARRAARLITRQAERLGQADSAPRPAAEPQEPARSDATPAAPPAEAVESKRVPDILIADDDPGVRELLARMLVAADPTYVVETATNGIEALAAVFWRRPRLVLLDITMPGMNGLDVLRQIRTFDPSLPVVLISGLVSEEAMADAVKNGVLAVVPKPFDATYIRRLVASVVS